MRKAMALILAAAAAWMVSGCVMLGEHTAKTEGGTRSTFGLISVSSVSDGYPMIPLYTHFEKSN